MAEASLGIAELVRRFYAELWEAGRSDVAAEILHPELAFRGSIGVEKRGVDGFLAYRDQIRGALEDYRCEIRGLTVEGDRAAAQMWFHGIHRAPMLGAAATGARVGWAGAAFFTLRDGRLAEIWVLGDVDGLRAALRRGAVAARAERPRPVTFYFSLASPYCYLAAPRVAALARRPDIAVALRPVLPIAVRRPEFYRDQTAAERRYFTHDVARTAAALGLAYGDPDPSPIVWRPEAGWRAAADQPLLGRLYGLLAAAEAQGRGLAMLSALWPLMFDGRAPGWDQDGPLAGAAAQAGLSLADLEAWAAPRAEAIAADLAANDAALTAAGHWGTPCFVLDDEPFFGQDRFDQLLWRLGLRPEDLA